MEVVICSKVVFVQKKDVTVKKPLQKGVASFFSKVVIVLQVENK